MLSGMRGSLYSGPVPFRARIEALSQSESGWMIGYLQPTAASRNETERDREVNGPRSEDVAPSGWVA